MARRLLFHRPMMRNTIFAAAAVSTFVLGGCARELEEDFAVGVAQSALETPDNQTPGQELAGSLKDPDDSGECAITAEAAAAEAADIKTVGLYDVDCVTKTATGNRVHVQFDGCTGPFGKVTIDGGVDATFSVDASCLVHAEIVDDGTLTANGQPFTYDADADIEVLENIREILWNAHWEGTTRRGRSIQQTAQLDLTLERPSDCVKVHGGTADGTLDTYEYGWEMSDLSVCPGMCPSSGTVQGWWKGYARERTVTVEFDGSAVAHVTGWTGRQFDVDLVCTPAL
jgi:hypothetical protein